MTTAPVIERSVRARPASRPARVAGAIARAEGLRLVRNPLFILAAAGAIPILIVQTTGHAPVMHRDDVFIGSSLYLLAGVTLLLVNLATTRRHRAGTADVEDAASSPPFAVTLGLLGSVFWAVGGALLVVGIELAVLRAMGGIWAPSARELLVGPSTVGALGALGVALGRWAPARAVGPLAVVAVAAVEIWLTSQTYSTDMNAWLALWPKQDSFSHARELVFRPVGWHVIYLAGIAGVFAALAVLRHGPAPRRTVVSVIAIVAVLGSAVGQARSEAVGEKADTFYTHHVAGEPTECRTIEGVRFCAYPAYAGWISRWARVLNGARKGFVAEPSTSVREVSQIWSEWDPVVGSAGVLWVTPEWGRFSRAGEFELGLALAASSLAVGLPPNGLPLERRLSRAAAKQLTGVGKRIYRAGDSVTYQVPCKAPAQARTVVALWLAARATPGSEAALRRMAEREPWGFYRDPDGEGIHFGGGLAYEWLSGAFGMQSVVSARSDVVRAVAMLDEDDRVEPIVRRHWRTLLDPATTADQLSEILALEPLPNLRSLLEQALEGQSAIWERITIREYGHFIRPDGSERLPRNDGPQLSCP